MRNEIIAELKKEADPEYRSFCEKLTPNSGMIIGVRMPVLRKTAVRILQKNPQQFLNEVQHEFYEEDILAALTAGSWNTDFSVQEKEYRRIIRYLKNWAVCDCFVSCLRTGVSDRTAFRAFLTPYLHSEKEFDQRFALVSLKCLYLKSEESIQTILKELQTLTLHGYYAEMAAAWLIAETACTQPKRTLQFLKAYDNETVKKKSIQKIMDSYRVSLSDKQKFRQLR